MPKLDQLFSNPTAKQLRLVSALVMLSGLGLWSLFTLVSGNMALASLATLAPASALFALLMTKARKLDSQDS